MFQTPIYSKIYQTINLCIRIARSKLDFNDTGDRFLMISPDYLFDYMDQHCQNQIANMLRTYKADNRLFNSQQSFISSLIANMPNNDERSLYYDFMWNHETFKSKITTLKKDSPIPYIKNIAGFTLEVMDYAIRDRWQVIAYMEGSRLGSGLDLQDIVRALSLKDLNSIHLDTDNMTLI